MAPLGKTGMSMDILILCISRCGEDLTTLFNTPAIQQFVNGIPAKETLSGAHIPARSTEKGICM